MCVQSVTESYFEKYLKVPNETPVMETFFNQVAIQSVFLWILRNF